MQNQYRSAHVPEFSKNWALFLDVDGTLLELAQKPDQVIVSKDLKAVLDGLKAQMGNAIALISGRPIDELDRLFNPARFAIAGKHGLERRDIDGNKRQHPVPDGKFTSVKNTLKEFANRRKSLLVEDKLHSIAIHYRQALEHQADLEKVLKDCMKDIEMNFHLQSGKMVYEIKPKGKDKGTAIRQFMHEQPFSGRVPVFVGDDLTDEDGFILVNGMGGHSIKVGEGDTLATWRLDHSSDVLNWLKSYSDFLKQ